MALLTDESIHLLKYTSFYSVNSSELLSEALKSQGKVSEESKKRKRESLLQPIRTEVPSFTTNTSSPSQGRNSVENQSATDSVPFLSSKMPYSQPAHEIMNSRTLTPTDMSTIQSTWSRLIFSIFLNILYIVFLTRPF